MRPEGTDKRDVSTPFRRQYSLTVYCEQRDKKVKKKMTKTKGKNKIARRRCSRRSSSVVRAIKYVKRYPGLKRAGEIFSRALPLQIRARGLLYYKRARLAETTVAKRNYQRPRPRSTTREFVTRFDIALISTRKPRFDSESTFYITLH